MIVEVKQDTRQHLLNVTLHNRHTRDNVKVSLQPAKPIYILHMYIYL
jgi:hypothetical protein